MALPAHVEDFVKDVIETCQKSGAIVHAVHKLFDFLEAEGLLYKQRIHCMAIGVHSQNRDGLGISWVDAHRLVSEISQLGFVSDQCKAVCVELDPHDVDCKRFNKNLQEEAKGKLGVPGSTDHIRFASLSCSHTNYAMRCIHEGVSHEDEDLTLDGVLSMERLGMKDPEFQKAVRSGLEWSVLSSRIISRFPELCSIIQGAGNASGQIARLEYDVQLLKKIFNSVKGKDVVNWEHVKQGILRTKPPNSSAAPRMFQFVVKFQGPEGQWLQESTAFCRSSSRQLPPTAYEALGLERKSVDQFPRLRHAFLKAMLMGPMDKAITVQDLKKFLHGKMADKAKEAEKLIGQVASLLQPVTEATEKEKLDIIGNFECRLVYYICEKKSESVPEYEDMTGAAHQAVEDINLICKSGPVVSPWVPSSAPHAACPAEPEAPTEGSRLDTLG